MPFAKARPTRVPPQAAVSRTHKYGIFPASVKGLDTSTPLMAQDPETALLLDNVFVRRYGSELRPGSTRHVTNLGGLATPQEVVSLMAYQPPRGPGSTFLPKLFAACTDGNIYDVTSNQNEAFVPPVSVSIPGQLQPGQFSWTNFSTAATNFLCICAVGGGYWTYDHTGGWVKRAIFVNPPGGGAAIDISNEMDFVMSWKNRLWFIRNNTSDAYYLAVNAIQALAPSPAGEFDFGPLLVHGGELKAMASWTVDGGDGIDDRLVLVGGGGDVLIYDGTDPTSAATFRIIGRWFVGKPPFGRRFLSKYAGDLAMVTEKGIEYMSRILQAKGELDPETQPKDTARIFNEVIGRDVRNTRLQRFWRYIALPSEEAVILITPHNKPKSGYQYVFNELSQAWSRHVGMGMSCAEEFDGELYYGTLEGTVIKAFNGTTDDQLSDGTPGRTVVADLQTAYVAPEDDPMSLKTPQLVMPMFTGNTPPVVKLQINTEWNFKPVPGSPPYVDKDTALWDQAKWDQAVWGGKDNTYLAWVGVEGLGTHASLRMSFIGSPRTVFTGWKYVYTSGGIM